MRNRLKLQKNGFTKKQAIIKIKELKKEIREGRRLLRKILCNQWKGIRWEHIIALSRLFSPYQTVPKFPAGGIVVNLPNEPIVTERLPEIIHVPAGGEINTIQIKIEKRLISEGTKIFV